MARCVVSSLRPGQSFLASGEQGVCAELAVNVAGKLAATFIRSGLLVSIRVACGYWMKTNNAAELAAAIRPWRFRTV